MQKKRIWIFKWSKDKKSKLKVSNLENHLKNDWRWQIDKKVQKSKIELSKKVFYLQKIVDFFIKVYRRIAERSQRNNLKSNQ